MSGAKIKKSLLEIAEKVRSKTTLEEVYEQLALLNDIEKSEDDFKAGRVYTHEQVKKMSKKWLK